jgi:MFS transporter, YNFM family, putative membrane transport protein
MDAGPVSPRARGGLLPLYLGTIAAYADMYVTQPILPLISREYGVGPAKAGLTISAVVLAIAVASSSYGPLSDVLGRKRVMVGSTALRAGVTVACAFVPSFGGLVALRAAQGALVPGMTAVSVAYAGDRYRARDLAGVVGGIIGASVIGGLVSRVGAGWIAAHVGWRAAFGASAAVSLVAALWMARALAPVQSAERRGFADSYRGMFAHLRNTRLAGAFLVGLSLFFGWTGIFTYLPYRLSGAPYFLSTGLVSSVYLVYAAGVVASVAAGRLSARVPARRLMGIGLGLGALGMAAVLARPLAVIVTGLVVLVLGTFTAQAIAPAFVNVTATRAKAGANALYLTFYYLGGTLGSVLPGLAWQRWAWPGVVGSCLGAMTLAIVANATLCGRPPLQS